MLYSFLFSLGIWSRLFAAETQLDDRIDGRLHFQKIKNESFILQQCKNEKCESVQFYLKQIQYCLQTIPREEIDSSLFSTMKIIEKDIIESSLKYGESEVNFITNDIESNEAILYEKIGAYCIRQKRMMPQAFFILELDPFRKKFYGYEEEKLEDKSLITLERLVEEGILKRVDENGWKYLFIDKRSDRGNEYFVTEGLWMKDQFAKGMSLKYASLNFWNREDEEQGRTSIRQQIQASLFYQSAQDENLLEKDDLYKEIYKAIDQGKKDARVDQDEKESSVIKKFSLKETAVLHYIFLSSEHASEDPVLKTMAEATRNRVNILKKMGYKIRFHSLSTYHPIKDLTEKLEKITRKIKEESGQDQIFIDLNGHGDHKGVHFHEKGNLRNDFQLTGEAFFNILKKFSSTDIFVFSISCHNGFYVKAFKEQENELKHVKALFQARESEMNEEGRNKKGEAYSTYFNLFFDHALYSMIPGKEGFFKLPIEYQSSFETRPETFGQALLFADKMVKLYVQSDAIFLGF
jgi:hypothetical protein